MGMGQKLGLSLVAVFVGLFIYAVVFEEDPVSMDPAHISGGQPTEPGGTTGSENVDDGEDVDSAKTPASDGGMGEPDPASNKGAETGESGQEEGIDDPAGPDGGAKVEEPIGSEALPEASQKSDSTEPGTPSSQP